MQKQVYLLTLVTNAAVKLFREHQSTQSCLVRAHELLPMIVFIQFYFYVVCQRRMWLKV